MSWTAEAVLALAPDDASAKAARGLVSPGKWPTLGANELAVWGECQGSGSKPYQTQVDLKGPAFRCSCPSRKFPCKHGLALLLMHAADASRFADPNAPAWVNEWLSSRAVKAEKQEQRAQAAASATPPDPRETAKREAARWARMAAAAEELQRWLEDQVRRGLGVLGEAHRAEWKTMAARLVDMQVPGLAQRVLDAASTIGSGPTWPERLLHRLGMLQLAVDALSRADSLTPAMRADLRFALGWPLDKEDVLSDGEKVRDRWLVMGQTTEERDDRLTERRVWLHGEQSGRRALLLEHAFAGKGFEQMWTVGMASDATLAYFPGEGRLRALCQALHSEPSTLSPAGFQLSDEWQAVARRVAAAPWTPLHPMLIADAAVHRTGDRMTVVAQGEALPLETSDADGWSLLAHGGGHPQRLMGEWDGERLRPLSAWGGECVWLQGDRS